jgi:hypothetical protein
MTPKDRYHPFVKMMLATLSKITKLLKLPKVGFIHLHALVPEVTMIGQLSLNQTPMETTIISLIA